MIHFSLSDDENFSLYDRFVVFPPKYVSSYIIPKVSSSVSHYKKIIPDALFMETYYSKQKDFCSWKFILMLSTVLSLMNNANNMIFMSNS